MAGWLGRRGRVVSVGHAKSHRNAPSNDESSICSVRRFYCEFGFPSHEWSCSEDGRTAEDGEHINAKEKIDEVDLGVQNPFW